MDLWRGTPLWALRILVAELPAIEADQTARMAQAASVPYLKDGDRRGFWRDVRAQTRPRGPATGPGPFSPELFSDLDAAHAYFESFGITVRRVPPA